MKRHIILLLGLSVLMIVITGCEWGILGPSECLFVDVTYTSTIKISVRDKQTGQPIPNARIHITRTEVFYNQVHLECQKIPVLVQEIATETDISGQFSFTYTYTIKTAYDSIVIEVDVTADQYNPLLYATATKPGVNEINLRMLNNVNQP